MPEETAPRIERRDDGSVAVVGALTVDAVPELWKAGQEHLADAPSVVLDLAGVTRCDSAGVAMVVQWVASPRTSQNVAVRGVPDQMRAILEVSDLGDLVTGNSAG